jgi:transposase
MNNARYQRSRLVMEMADVPDMELLYLPVYSPSLNHIERVWLLIKARGLRKDYIENFILWGGPESPATERLGRVNLFYYVDYQQTRDIVGLQ